MALPDARDESAAADAGNDRGRVGRVFKNLQSHRRMAGDEIVIVERMHERPFGSGKRRDPRGPSTRQRYGTGMSFAPSAFMRSIFEAGAVSIATTVQGTPAFRAA